MLISSVYVDENIHLHFAISSEGEMVRNSVLC